jgi:aspartate aminotransferase-like enzyme
MVERFGRWFLPGPCAVHPEVQAAMARPLSASSPEALQAELRQPLQDLFRTTRDVITAASSATGFMEAAIRCGVEERVLVVIGGEYGERFAQVAEACGKEVVRAMVHPGRTLESEHLAQFLDGPEVDAVALVHTETSTGALAPLHELVPVIRARKDVHVLVDAAGSLAGCPVETDQWGLDFVFSGSSKALALPPGLALGVVSPRFLSRAAKLAGRGRHLDLVRLAESSGKPSQDQAELPHMRALSHQLRRIAAAGGIEARWARHHQMLTMVEEWVLLRPAFSLLALEGRRAWTVSTICLPPGLSSQAVVTEMRNRGWEIARGYGDLGDSTIRIGHMGDLSADDLVPLLDDLDQVARPGSGSQRASL